MITVVMVVAVLGTTYPGSIPNGILFGLGFSAFFFVSTGHFLPFLKRPVRPGQAPTETTSLQDDGKAMVKRPSLFDDQALVRWVVEAWGVEVMFLHQY